MLGKVVANVVSTMKHPDCDGYKLLVVQTVDQHGQPARQIRITITIDVGEDRFRAAGDTIRDSQESSSAVAHTQIIGDTLDTRGFEYAVLIEVRGKGETVRSYCHTAVQEKEHDKGKGKRQHCLRSE